MLPLNQSRKIALIAVALFVVSMGILFVFTQKDSLLSGSLKSQIFGETGGNSREEMVNSSADPVVVIDSENKISYTSPSFKELLGYTDEELNGVDFFKLVHPDDASDIASFVTKIVQTKEEMKNLGPYRIKDNGGEYKVYMASASVVS
ncbi:PAS domain S-box protein, partial [Candidatus Peregrinibacteria bacterium]|nr:PAS domain S-box protein [Candidatus Peregrinibacteria bacterium]